MPLSQAGKATGNAGRGGGVPERLHFSAPSGTSAGQRMLKGPPQRG